MGGVSAAEVRRDRDSRRVPSSAVFASHSQPRASAPAPQPMNQTAQSRSPSPYPSVVQVVLIRVMPRLHFQKERPALQVYNRIVGPAALDFPTPIRRTAVDRNDCDVALGEFLSEGPPVEFAKLLRPFLLGHLPPALVKPGRRGAEHAVLSISAGDFNWRAVLMRVLSRPLDRILCVFGRQENRFGFNGWPTHGA
jgi:hypothetical protein